MGSEQLTSVCLGPKPASVLGHGSYGPSFSTDSDLYALLAKSTCREAINVVYWELEVPRGPTTGSKARRVVALEVEAKFGTPHEWTFQQLLVQVLNNYIFIKKDIKFKRDKYFLTEFLKDRKGNCFAITTLYLAIAERLGLPFSGVTVPNHVFVRYQENDNRINIEITQNGNDLLVQRVCHEAYSLG